MFHTESKYSLGKKLSDKSKKKKIEINSWNDLNRLKNKYRIEKFLLKSKDKLMEENLKMIQKLEDAPPKIDTWNRTPQFNRSINDSVASIKEKLFDENM